MVSILVAYADIILLVKDREAMLAMLDTLRKFLKERKLILNANKPKVLVFNKNWKEKTEAWKWREEYLEEVKMYKYLGYIFNRKSNYKEHINKMRRKGRIAANKVWGLEERLCRNNSGRR